MYIVLTIIYVAFDKFLLSYKWCTMIFIFILVLLSFFSLYTLYLLNKLRVKMKLIKKNPKWVKHGVSYFEKFKKNQESKYHTKTKLLQWMKNRIFILSHRYVWKKIRLFFKILKVFYIKKTLVLGLPILNKQMITFVIDRVAEEDKVNQYFLNQDEAYCQSRPFGIYDLHDLLFTWLIIKFCVTLLLLILGCCLSFSLIMVVI